MNPLVLLAVMPLTTLSLILTSGASARCVKCSLQRVLFLCFFLFLGSLLLLSTFFPPAASSSPPIPGAEPRSKYKEIHVLTQQWTAERPIAQVEKEQEHEEASLQENEAEKEVVAASVERMEREQELEKLGLIRRRTLGQNENDTEAVSSDALSVMNDCNADMMVHVSDSQRSTFLDWLYVLAKSQSAIATVANAGPSTLFSVTIYIHDGKSVTGLPRVLCAYGSWMAIVGEVPEVGVSCHQRREDAEDAKRHPQVKQPQATVEGRGNDGASDLESLRSMELEEAAEPAVESRQAASGTGKVSSKRLLPFKSASWTAGQQSSPPLVSTQPTRASSTLIIHNTNDTLNVSAEVYDFFSNQLLDTLTLSPGAEIELSFTAFIYVIRASISRYSPSGLVVWHTFKSVSCKRGGRVWLQYSDETAGQANGASCDAQHSPGSSLVLRNRSDVLARLIVRDIPSGAVLQEVYLDSGEDMDLSEINRDVPAYFTVQLMHSEQQFKPVACGYGATATVLGRRRDGDIRTACDDDHRITDRQLAPPVKIMNGSGMCPVTVRVVLPADGGDDERQLDEFVLACGESGSSWIGAAGKRKVLVKLPTPKRSEERQIVCSGSILIGENGLYC